jgi:hypothetical protein
VVVVVVRRQGELRIVASYGKVDAVMFPAEWKGCAVGWQRARTGFPSFETGTPDADTHVEIAEGVWVPRDFTSSFLTDDRRLWVDLAGTINRHGSPIVASLHIAAHEDSDRGVDRDQLRAIPVAELLRRAVLEHSWIRHGETWRTHVGGDGLPVAAERVRRQGRRITRQHLERVAEVYRTHQGPDPTREVATRLNLAYSTAAKHVTRARDAGLLPPTSAGKATNNDQEQER